MYQVIFNEKENIQVATLKNDIVIGDESLAWDIKKLNDNLYHLLYKQKSYTIEIREEEPKKFTVKINGKQASIEIKDKLDLLLEKLGLDAADSGKLQSIKAPMPGLIVDIKVKPGDEVNKGDQLLILEAMKMENIIKSPGEGTVKAVSVKQGEGVEKNQVLIQF